MTHLSSVLVHGPDSTRGLEQTEMLMKTEVLMKSSLFVVAVMVILGAGGAGIGAFALFAAAMGGAWWLAAAFAAVAAAGAAAAGAWLGRRSGAAGRIGAAALAAPSAALGLMFVAWAVIDAASGQAGPGVPVAGPAFLAIAVLLWVPAALGARVASRAR
jgi:hypothetical protein